MNMKKIAVLALSLCMVAAIAVTGTIAYFTDTDTETNTFTVGNVEIDLVETFDEENALLRPGTQTENKIEKKVWIENIGTEPAYVWYEWYIPSALDTTDGRVGHDNRVHVNSNGNSWDKYCENPKYWAEGQTAALPLEQTWDHDPEVELGIEPGPEGFVGKKTIDGIEYNKYIVLYHGVLEPKAGTSVAMNGVYLDNRVDYDNDNDYYTFNGQKIDYDFTKGINIVVDAFGIQSTGLVDQDGDGKVTVYDAYLTYNK